MADSLRLSPKKLLKKGNLFDRNGLCGGCGGCGGGGCGVVVVVVVGGGCGVGCGGSMPHQEEASK